MAWGEERKDRMVGRKKHTGRKESLFSRQGAPEASHAGQNLKWRKTTVCVCVSVESSYCEEVLEHPSTRWLLCQVNVCDIFEKKTRHSSSDLRISQPQSCCSISHQSSHAYRERHMTWLTLLNEFLLTDFLHPKKFIADIQVLNRFQIFWCRIFDGISKHPKHHNVNLYANVLTFTAVWNGANQLENVNGV